MQDILGYSPLEAGVRFLPATLMIVAVAPIAGPAHGPVRAALADRDGPDARRRLAVLADRHRRSTPPTATCWPSFILMGIGMALVMSPMSTAAMNAVAVPKAGVASGVLSMNRMVGGTLGVAVTGAIFQAIAPAGTHDPAKFVDAFSSAMWVATGVTLAGAITAVALLRGKAAGKPQAATAEAEAFAAPRESWQPPAASAAGGSASLRAERDRSQSDLHAAVSLFATASHPSSGSCPGPGHRRGKCPRPRCRSSAGNVAPHHRPRAFPTGTSRCWSPGCCPAPLRWPVSGCVRTKATTPNATVSYAAPLLPKPTTPSAVNHADLGLGKHRRPVERSNALALENPRLALRYDRR